MTWGSASASQHPVGLTCERVHGAEWKCASCLGLAVGASSEADVFLGQTDPCAPCFTTMDGLVLSGHKEPVHSGYCSYWVIIVRVTRWQH